MLTTTHSDEKKFIKPLKNPIKKSLYDSDFMTDYWSVFQIFKIITQTTDV